MASPRPNPAPVVVRWIDGRPRCPECGDDIVLRETHERPDEKLPLVWFLVCPVCETRYYQIPGESHQPLES